MRGERGRAGRVTRPGRGATLGSALLLLASAAASADPGTAVLLCVDDAAAEARPAAALERWLKGVRLVLVEGACRQPAGGRQLLARFERRAAAVDLVLQPPAGQALRRRVPWLARTDGALARLAARGRLSELSVLLAALVAESRGAPRFGRAQVRPAHAATRGATAAAPMVGQPQAAVTAPAAAARSNDAPPAPATLPAVADDTGKPAPAVSAAPSPSTPAGDGARWRRRPPRPATVRPAPARRVPAVRAAAPPSHAARGRWRAALRRIAIGAHSAARFRASDVWSAEIGGALRWRSLFVRAGYQLPATWDLAGRPVEVSAVPLALGWQPRLWRGATLQIAGVAALVAEQTAVRRTDLPAARTHRFWDLGGILGGAALLRLSGSLEVALSVEATLLPAARTVQVPDGPAAALSRFAVQSALTLWWGGRDG